MRPYCKAGNLKRKIFHFEVDRGLGFVRTFCGTGGRKAWTVNWWENVTCKHCLHNKEARPKTVERMAKSTNKPSAKCYSVSCPAIWFDKCTSSKYGQCAVRESE